MKNRIRRKDPRPRALKRQRDVLCDVMLSAGSCETWLTLVELSRMTQYGRGQHLGSIAAFAKAAVRGICSGEATAGSGRGDLQRGARAGVGIPIAARTSGEAAGAGAVR